MVYDYFVMSVALINVTEVLLLSYSSIAMILLHFDM